jgi:hypothetical protein
MINLSKDNLRVPEFAAYYGYPVWTEGFADWVKSLLLFFDGIALTLPKEDMERLIESDPVLAQPLAEQGLLRSFLQDFASKVKPWPPETWSQGTDDIAERISRAKQRFGDVPAYPHLLALAIGGISIAIARNITEVAIQPVIDDEDAASFVAAVIGPHDNGRARIMTSDLRQVGVDMHAVPLDEVLDFRSQHGSEFRAYSRQVRQFVLELSLQAESDQASAFVERRAELDDRAEELRRAARSAFKRQAISLGFGLAGAAWTLVHGDAWGGIFVAGAAAAGLSAPTPGPIGAAYAYILRAKTELEH